MSTPYARVLEFLRDFGSEPRRIVQRGVASPTPLRCVRFPLSRTPGTQDRSFGFRPELIEFWNQVGVLRLFEDTEYGQWGLVTLPPYACIEVTEFERKNRPTEFRDGDLIVAEFLGDLEKVVVTADGRAYVCLPLDGRASWPLVGTDFEEFLLRFISSGGVKFWD
ncbi:hypothetical protein [Calidithermus chliarophilus]|uniref:hypothetical protein n=1 Tax=Calidithermus chliarophilus TaxID=52023 RepID=UPI0012F6538D|nr:hypothetical protein [Calidithermus chliarophilus]